MENPAPHAAVLAAIESLGGTLAMARALVEGGRQVDLTGLDREVASLCAAVVATRPDAARPLRPALEALRAQVDRVAAALPAPGA